MNASARRPRRASTLLARLRRAPRGITADSRQVRPGDAFAAFPGSEGRRPRVHRRRHRARRRRRAVGRRRFAWDPTWHVPNVGVADLKRAARRASPTSSTATRRRTLWVIGVTGTNGKTSCSQWIAQCLDACGRRAAVLGTLGNGLVGALAPSAEHDAGRRAAARDARRSCKAEGAQAVAMEVSSHGLDQGRVNAVAFDVALFTNLTRDHLDYHGTMAAYGAAKARLFALAGARHRGDQRRRSVRPEPDRRRARPRPPGADLRPRQRRHRRHRASTATPAGIALTVATPWGRGDARAPGSPARSTRATCWACSACCWRATCRSTTPLAALARRRRRRRAGCSASAATASRWSSSTTRTRPTRWRRCCTALRPAVADGGELVCVFGCGGDRDPGKRPEMGRVAAALADAHRRHQRQPAQRGSGRDRQRPSCAASREAGHRRWHVELDRAQAIRAAMAGARWRRRRADRRQGPRGLPGGATACARRSPTRAKSQRGAGGDGAAHDGHGDRRARSCDGRLRRRERALRARDDRHAHAARRATCSSRSRASASTATISSPRRSSAARRRRWSPRRAPARSAGNLVAVRRPAGRAGGGSPRTGGGSSRCRWSVVVGSNGKTTVKEMLAAILRAHSATTPCSRPRATSTTRSACR